MQRTPEFQTELNCTPLPDGVNWRVNSPLKFLDADGALYVVPAGFVTDFASIPPLATIGGLVLLGAIPFSFIALACGWTLAFAILCVVIANALFVVLVADALNGDDALDYFGTVHDYGYRVWRGSKAKWDAVGYRCMVANRRPLWKRLVIYESVLLFGWRAWRADGRKLKR